MLHERAHSAKLGTDDVQPGTLRWTAAAGAAVLVVHTILVARVVSEATTIIANVVFASWLLVLASRSGLTRELIGVTFTRQVRVVATAATGVVVLVVLIATAFGLVPDDPAVSRLGPAEVWFRILIAIPIGTAVCEEVIFRGVFLAAGDRLWGARWSTVIVSAAFGLWHIAAEAHRTGGPGTSVLPGVIATGAVSAFVFCPLRRRTGSLAAPIAVHAVANVGVFLAVLLAPSGVG